MKKILEFLSENFQFLVVKFSVYVNRRVFVMNTVLSDTKYCQTAFLNVFLYFLEYSLTFPLNGSQRSIIFYWFQK